MEMRILLTSLAN
jgi:chromosome segregation ATPase